MIAQKDYLVEPIVESPRNLYNQCEGLAFTCEEFAAKKSYIGFKQPLQFLYQTASTPNDSLLQPRQAGGSRGQQQMSMINTASQQ